MNKLLSALALSSVAVTASAATGSITVGAYENSTTWGNGSTYVPGIGVSTFDLLAGQAFTVSVDPNDLWTAGYLPRWSNADGLLGDLFYQPGTTDGQVAAWLPSHYYGVIGEGLKIGSGEFGNWTQGGLTTAYGTLVGQVGGGDFFKIGTSFSGVASSAGSLKLFYFDSNNVDNAGSVLASVTAVPEPETYAMMLAGPGMIGAMARRRRV